MRIYLDPGHSNKKKGAIGKIDEELQAWKLSTLYISKYLKAMGYEVGITRSRDEIVDLPVRAQRAKGSAALVSIHFNAGGGDGAEVYPQFYGDKAICAKSKALATNLLNELVAGGQQPRGIKTKSNSFGTREYYGIIYEARKQGVPAVLLEVAFVDTKDALDFDTDTELDKWGKAIANGIAATFPLIAKKPYTIEIKGTATRSEAEGLLARVKAAGFPAILNW